MKLLNNLLLVEPIYFNMVGNLFVPESSEVNKYLNVCGTIVKAPDRLIYREYHPHTLHVYAEFDFQVGDTVFYHFTCMQDANAKGMWIEHEGKKCMLVNARDCYVSKRGNEIILHNGFCLAEPLDSRPKSTIIIPDSVSQSEDNKDLCVMAYLSKPIKEYKWGNEWKVIPPDDNEIKVGDTIKLMRYGGRLLEQLSDNLIPGKKFYFFQRRDIVGKIVDGNIQCVSNRLLIKEDDPYKKIGSLYIPDTVDARSKKSKWGTVVSAGNGSSIKKGQHVCYDYGYGFEVEHNREVYYCILDVHILYVTPTVEAAAS